MTDTANLGLPFIEGGQAQKHITHNEALRILDAAIQIAVRDMNRSTPPVNPAEGERHVVALGASGAWAGQGNAIATWQDGAWAFLQPRTGWCIWSVADDMMMVFDGSAWRDLRNLAVDSVAHLGINTTATAPNLLSVTSNAALFAAIDAADGGSGDVRVQLSKESAAKTASVYFSDNQSGRAEFGLVESNTFKLKVSPDGAHWIEAFTIDHVSGNLALPRGVALTGVIAPPVITADQNDYAPAGLAAASVLQISTDVARSISGLAGGTEGRVVTVINTGSQTITLRDNSASSMDANRFAFGGDLTIAGRQAAVLRYDGTAARWQAIAGGLTLHADRAQVLTTAQQAQGKANLGLDLHGGDLASAATLNLESATGDLVDVTGTTTISAITLSDGHERTVRFVGSLTLTHGAALLLPGAANIITAAGDFAVFRGYADGVVRCVDYSPAGALPANRGGTGNTGGAWTTYTPVLTSQAGALSATNCSGAYMLIGKTCFFRLVTTVTINGSGSDSLNVTLPFIASGTQGFCGREIALIGYSVTGHITATSSVMTFRKYDNSYAGANGASFTFSGVYETA